MIEGTFLETKDDLLTEICDLLSIQVHQTTVGSSIPRRFFSDLLDFFDLPDDGDAVTACKRIVGQANQVWNKEFSSESSPSGGGGTVTLAGLKALRNAVSILLDELEAQSNSSNSSEPDKLKDFEWTLLRGQTILRRKLHDIYGGIRQGGISPSNSTRNVFLFTDDATNREHGYERDHWLDDLTFIYCGDGQRGHQELSGRNGTILKHLEQGRKLRLFSPVAGLVTYLGELTIDTLEPYSLKQGIGRDGLARTVVLFKLKRVLSRQELPTGKSEILSSDFGTNYKYADEDSKNITEIKPFTSDPNLLDRALRLHAITQNTVANWVMGNGLSPVSPSSSTCDFDIAWESDYGKVVCEVKSLSDDNESHQFRLGLGQVLEYAHILSALPILVFSRKPNNQGFIDIANSAGVKVLWPEILANYNPSDLRNVRAR